MAVLAFGSLIPAVFLTLPKLGTGGSSPSYFDTSKDHLRSHSPRPRYHCPPRVFRSWFASFLVVYTMTILRISSQKWSFRVMCYECLQPATSRPLHAYQRRHEHPQSTQVSLSRQNVQRRGKLYVRASLSWVGAHAFSAGNPPWS
jgi:hypothetical protein